MSKRDTHLFTYGSLMFAPVWRKVAKPHYRTSEETIRGYVRYTVAGEHYPAVIGTPHLPLSTLTGRVYWDIDAEDIARLDRFEGDDYKRVSVQTVSGQTVSLYLFIASERLSMKPWDPKAFEENGMKPFLERYAGFDQ
jgi:gamma-glutamylcyclotransferase (GGCT)/AIG2-like uncharacterized protein YtfP